MSEPAKAAVLGLVQGISEFFPISSSAHLRALRVILDFQVEGLAFDIAVHVATLGAVVVYFRREILSIARGPKAVPVALRLAAASIPLFLIGYLFGGHRESLSLWVLVLCWLFSGTYLLLLKGIKGDKNFTSLSLPRIALIGVAQSLAFFPGMSRSGSTIAAGLLVGLSRDQAATFSFLLAIPAILGAGAYQTLKFVRDDADTGSLGLALGIAMPVAFVVGLLAIHLLLRMVRGNAFYRFGYYNLAAAMAFASYLVWS